MKTQDLKFVESQLQYEFKNKSLLSQAFMLYSSDSDILANIGKKSLSFTLMNILIQYYGVYNKNQVFGVSNKSEGFNDLINNLLSSKIIVENVDILGLNLYIEPSPDGVEYYDIKDKLFYSIIGAITLDSNWSMDTLKDSISYLLNVDYYLDHGFRDYSTNYTFIVRKWSMDNEKPLPYYSYDSYYDEFGNYVFNCRAMLDGVDEVLEADGTTRGEARLNAAKMLHAYLAKNNMISQDEEISLSPKRDLAVKQLEKLSQSGYFPKPVYKYKKTDKNTFICRISIVGYPEMFEAEGETQAKATLDAAYSMLLFVLGYED